jgi:ubiquinone/menaquinone biosynthesis C-methylase UbiE
MDRPDAGALTRGRADLAVIVRSRTALVARSTIVEAATRAADDLGIRVVIEVAEPGIDLEKISSGIDSEFVMFVDDSVHDVNERIKELWAQRETADLLISSRYSEDRGTRPKELRREAERYVDRFLARILTLDTHDVRSTFQLIRRDTLADIVAQGADLDDPVDVCVRTAVHGWTTREVQKPFWPLYTEQPTAPRRPTAAALFHHWARRNGIDSADYDMRAFNSRLPPQRAWQRQRHEKTYELVLPFQNQRMLNVGAGSGRLSLDLPGSISVDIVHAKLRYMRRYNVNPAVTASVFHLPFSDDAFDCVVCCEVVEHVPRDPSPIAELVRVLRPGGRLVLSTPDYGTPVWPLIERLYAAAQPKGYADEHITHYTEASLIEEMRSHGLRCVGLNRVYRAIVVGAFE